MSMHPVELFGKRTIGNRGNDSLSARNSTGISVEPATAKLTPCVLDELASIYLKKLKITGPHF